MPPIVGVAEHYAQFVELARARINELNVSLETVDEVSGFPARYTAKLLCKERTMSVFSFFTLARTLALLPSFAHDETQLGNLRSHAGWKLRRSGAGFRGHPSGVIKFNNYREFYRQIGRKGAKRKHALSKFNKERARKGAAVRWGK